MGGQLVSGLDDDQLLGAILRRAAELGLEPSVTWDSEMDRWEFVYTTEWDRKWNTDRFSHGPTPLSAALEAVEELCKETT